MNETPEVYNSIATTADNLEQLLTEIVDLRLSSKAFNMMYDLAHLRPFQRLMSNMSMALWLVKGHRPFNALTDGLSPEEREVLIEIDSANTSLDARRTAHSLLDIEERLRLIKLFTGTFKDRWERRRHVLTKRPLDDN